MRPTTALAAIAAATVLMLAGCDRADPPPSSSDLAQPPALPAVEPAASSAANGAGDDTATVSFTAAQAADSDVWYTAAEGATACTMATTPGQEVDRLQAQGATTTTVDNAAADGSLIAVVVRWTDSSGAQSATYYRKLGDCEATLPQAQVIPDRYKR